MPHLTLFDKGANKSHRVDGAEALVGRDPACGIFLDGEAAKTVSGRHARVFIEDGKWYLQDAGSRNGTYIGTRRIDPGARHPLAVGEVIGLGLTGTQLLVEEAVGRAFAATMIEAPAPAVAEFATAAARSRRNDVAGAGSSDPDFSASGSDVRLVLVPKGGPRVTGQGDHVTIGRALECLIRIEGEAATSVSRLHAEVVAGNSGATIRDAGSRHGTFVNGKKIDGPHLLKRGDQITFGPIGQTYTVDEVALLPPGSTPRHSSPTRADDEPFQAELPTPSLPRAAVRTDGKQPANPSPSPARANPAPAAPASRAAAPPQLPAIQETRARSNRNRIRIAIGVVAAIAILAIVGFLAYMKGQSSAATGSQTTGEIKRLTDAWPSSSALAGL